MSRKRKVEVITAAIAEHSFGTPMSEEEYRWLAEHIIDALKRHKAEKKSKEQ